MRFSTSGFFHGSNPYGCQIHTLKIFSFEFAEKFEFESWSSGLDTPQDFVRRGIRPYRTLICGVSDPAEQAPDIKCTQLCLCSVGSDTTQDLFPWCLIPCRILSEGPDAPQDLVLRGIRPHWQIKTPQNQKKMF
jgi:hypothetical protein